MEVPNIETIESSLRNCFLSQRTTPPDPETADITVDLNSDLPLPYPWIQFLNLQTGEIYYLNKTDGTKTRNDPRRSSTSSATSDSEPASVIDDNVIDNDHHEETEDTASSDDSSLSSLSSAISIDSSNASTACTGDSLREMGSSSINSSSSGSSHVLVLVGCTLCFTLSMVTRSETECAKCGSAALRRF